MVRDSFDYISWITSGKNSHLSIKSHVFLQHHWIPKLLSPHVTTESPGPSLLGSGTYEIPST